MLDTIVVYWCNINWNYMSVCMLLCLLWILIIY